jgi:hypothetical protein
LTLPKGIVRAIASKAAWLMAMRTTIVSLSPSLKPDVLLELAACERRHNRTFPARGLWTWWRGGDLSPNIQSWIFDVSAAAITRKTNEPMKGWGAGWLALGRINVSDNSGDGARE